MPGAVMTQLCDEIADQVPALAPTCSRIAAQVTAPLRVAIVGRVNAGKSTLVNAMLGRRISPTPVSEWTRVPTWIRFGAVDAAVLIPKSGAPRPLPFTADGCLPLELSQPASSIRRVEVTLNNEELRSLVLIDTPGLGAINEGATAVTLELLNTAGDYSESAEAADAVIFVLSQTLTAEDRKVIDEFAEKASGPWSSPLRMIVVLTKADLLADDDGDLDSARRVAQRFAAGLRHRVVNVVPVVGLLAETARCKRLTEPMVEEIVGVANASDRRMQLASPTHFAGNSPLRKKILERLSTFGLAAAVDFVDGDGKGALDLSDHLLALSGIASLDAIVSRRFRSAAAVLQAERGVREFEVIAADRERLSVHEAQVVRDALDRARLDPAMHRIAELRAEESLLRGDVRFRDDKVQAAALRILSPGSPEERLLTPAAATPAAATRAADPPAAGPGQLAAIAWTTTEDWHEISVLAIDPDRERIAATVSRSAHLLYRELSGQQ